MDGLDASEQSGGNTPGRQSDCSRKGNLDAILRIVGSHDFKETLFIIDLPGIESIKTAFFLHKIKHLQPVLVFGNPLHPNGLVGGNDYISALLGYGGKLEMTKAGGYVFILDSNRYGDYTEEDFRKFFNNQYELIDEDMPPLEMLKNLGYNKIVCISGKRMKEDCEAYLKYLEELSFPVYREILRED
jgi:hypothetical protein